MGLSLFRHSAESVVKPTSAGLNMGNPDPARFVLDGVFCVGRMTLVRVRYPNCQNHEGNKILVFMDVTEEMVRSWAVIDPHFLDPKERQPHPSPVARFAPTDDGLQLAIGFMNAFNVGAIRLERRDLCNICVHDIPACDGEPIFTLEAKSDRVWPVTSI